MKKDVTHRIAYYTKKVSQSFIHPSKPKPRSYKYRNARLGLYKRLLHEEIERQGYKK